MKKRRLILFSFVAFVLAIAFYLVIAPGQPEEPAAVKTPAQTTQRIREVIYTVKRGDTFDGILREVGVSPDQAIRLIESIRGVRDLKRCQIGDELRFSFDEKGDLLGFVYRSSPVDVCEVKWRSGRFEALSVEVPTEKKIAKIHLKLDSSLYNALLNAGESATLVEKMVDIFAWDIDFYSDPRKGDEVSLLVEKIYVDGKFFDYGRVLMAEYAGDIVDITALYYENSAGEGVYFDENGRSLARNFLKSPVKYTRISSRFGMRRHPITHRLKNHLGTDYAAPVGSTVWAMADGIVVKRSYNKYNGNYIAIRHGKGYETQYLHLSRFAPGIAVGKRVRQKDIIGYVGTTGRSTGPHLHLGVKRNGRFINALKIKKVKEKALAGKDLEDFKAQFTVRLAELKGRDDTLVNLPGLVFVKRTELE